jgi:tetraacyldisaccharide 4'-kinase
VEHIVRTLAAGGWTPGVVSRGYGRKSRGVVVVSDGGAVFAGASEGGDEPVQIAKNCPGARVVVGERRTAAAGVAVNTLGCDVLVMDDGFQHRYLRRSLDLVVLDGRSDPFEDGLLPAGMLRERVSGLRRAGLIALSRSDSVDVPWRGKLAGVYRGPVVAFVTEGAGLERLAGADSSGDERGPFVAFSGIGDHGVFLAELERLGVGVAGDCGFRDHHRYGTGDAVRLCGLLAERGARGFVTTEKDAARLQATPEVVEALASSGPIFTLGVKVRLTAGERELESALERLKQRLK